jgi:predicted RecA/RadA family phage recombinase
MQAQFVHDGKAVDFTPTADVAVGSIVIQGDLVGITKRDIKAGSLGSIAVEGVFDIPKDPDLAVEFEAAPRCTSMKTARSSLTMSALSTSAKSSTTLPPLIPSSAFA